ncbi:methylated-DNA--[protein]-cysteine S-methyltransferase [Chitinilyticum piscinae]|uniref:Methylated-DNA--[protein]-cysteine S-methyltransferase n=1 Tax=Chitinilyticum piscinae TaxID=2866724 RepID=A0A8J7FYX3_9NEIS|nr:methylated-DNA--[protein]-cysteine S-methyltransferase [Chitinilyticum piscinae]MBE9608900.1 methylated-DNA--[protein]-cysteine S-methyltransferase [Chitinilyticum piscinae]
MQNPWQLDEFQVVLATPFGKLGVSVVAERIRALEFLPEDIPLRSSHDALLREFAAQLRHYCADPRFQFDLPYALQGTAHQLKVWKAISEIPSGMVSRYGKIAEQIGSSPRAVGNACGRNPLPLLIPCHRVVAAGSGLGGFNASRNGVDWLPIKRWLLRHEGVAVLG